MCMHACLPPCRSTSWPHPQGRLLQSSSQQQPLYYFFAICKSPSRLVDTTLDHVDC